MMPLAFATLNRRYNKIAANPSLLVLHRTPSPCTRGHHQHQSHSMADGSIHFAPPSPPLVQHPISARHSLTLLPAF